MKSPLFFLMGIVALTVLNAHGGWCHGVEGYTERIEAHCISAMYDDGEPMSYAAVEIKGPGSDIAFQTGRTDRNGCFTVKTDTPGTWQVVVSDGMGHRLALDFSVAPDSEEAQTAEEMAPIRTARPMDRKMGIAAGLSIIFGLCGVAYGWKAKGKS